MSTAGLYVVVALAGAAVLVIEILGTRLLGPFYGVSLYLWSALISVTLASLSLGYAVGGRWADRRPSAAVLARILTTAGLWTMAVPWLRQPLLAATEGWGLRAAVLVSAAVLFVPPLTLLGMVSPFAIRLRLESVDHAGRTSGNLYAISTVASVAGALATGFWLIPAVGVTRLTFIIGAVLLLAAGIAELSGSGLRRKPATAAALALAAVAVWLAARSSEAHGPGLLQLRDSPYAELRVLERQGRRSLLVDGGIHTQVDSETRAPLLPYAIVGELAGELYPSGSRLLLVGLGGGSVARLFTRSGWKVEAVEIDSAVTGFAHQFFGLGNRDAVVHHEDGRRFLATTKDRWDVIFLDAFGSASIPFHLVTREAMALARSRLRPGGTLVLNVESVGWHSPLVHAIGATLRTQFPNLVVFPIAEPPNQLGNLILMGRDRPIEIAREDLGDPVGSLADDYEHWRVLTRLHAWDNRFAPEPGWGPVLTDDLNPSDLWAEETNRAARKALHSEFALGGSW